MIELISRNETFYVVDDTERPTVKIGYRRIPADEYAAIRARHTQTIDEPGGIRREVTDEAAVDADSLDYIVICWPLGVALEGQPVECTRAAKLLLPRPVRTELLTRGFQAINATGATEIALKNWPTPSGTPGPAGSQTRGA